MKIDRLLGILVILLRNELVTAPQLAVRFEVSRRTINRDIEDLCKAGIPITTLQGTGGGIRIASGYKIDKNLFTAKERQAVLAGLKSMDSIDCSISYQALFEKLLGADEDKESIYDVTGSILIDLASYHKESLAPKIQIIKEAINESRCAVFDYYSPSGESHRVIEPYLIVFQWANWYIYGYCLEKKAFRMFKLNRLINLAVGDESFEKRKLPEFKFEANHVYKEKVRITAEFDKKCKWRLIDEYGVESFNELPSGKLWFEFDFISETKAIEILLSFGEQVKIISPLAVKEKLLETIEKCYLNNKET